MATECTHLEQVEVLEPEGEVAGCEECLADGGRWVHLRMCHTCGHVGCCDSSPGRHASGHHADTGHPLMRSVEPGERWSFCFEDEVTMRLSAS